MTSVKQADGANTATTTLVDAEKGSQQDAVVPPPKSSVYKNLGWLDRLLALWILLAIIIGILIGNFVNGAEEALQKGKFVQVSVPVAVGLLVMMYPILCKVKYETMHLVLSKRDIWVQIGFSIVLNWVVAPLLMVSIVCERSSIDVAQYSFPLFHSSVWPGLFCLINLVFVPV